MSTLSKFITQLHGIVCSQTGSFTPGWISNPTAEQLQVLRTVLAGAIDAVEEAEFMALEQTLIALNALPAATPTVPTSTTPVEPQTPVDLSNPNDDNVPAPQADELKPVSTEPVNDEPATPIVTPLVDEANPASPAYAGEAPKPAPTADLPTSGNVLSADEPDATQPNIAAVTAIHKPNGLNEAVNTENDSNGSASLMTARAEALAANSLQSASGNSEPKSIKDATPLMNRPTQTNLGQTGSGGFGMNVAREGGIASEKSWQTPQILPEEVTQTAAASAPTAGTQGSAPVALAGADDDDAADKKPGKPRKPKKNNEGL